jgi:photosystem II stability/assembly factor-like uncharacterized protein
MKSSDGGAHWSSTALSNAMIPTVIVDPDTSYVLAGLANGNVVRSIDGGDHWTTVINDQTAWEHMAYSPPDLLSPRHFYAVGTGAGAKLYRSDDHGANWIQLSPPLSQANQFGMRVATSFINPQTIYLLAPSDRKVLVSNDLGSHWTDITGNLASINWFWAQNGYNESFAVSSVGDGRVLGTGQDVIYAGGTDLYQSIGQSGVWQILNNGHTDQHALAVNPFDRNSLLAGNDGGVYSVTYVPELGITTTVSTNVTLGVTQFYDISISTYDPSWIVGGAQDTGSPFSADDLTNWLSTPSEGDGGGCSVNPLNKNWMFSTSNFSDASPTGQRTMLHTTTGWQAWTDVSGPLKIGGEAANPVPPMVIDPNQPWLLYTGTTFLYRWDENTQSWTSHLGNQQLGSNGNSVDAIAIAPSDSNRIYTASFDGQIWMSTTQGSSWTEIDGGQLTNRNLSDLSVDPNNENDLLVAATDGGPQLLRCTNAQANPPVWTDVSQGLPNMMVHSIARDPNSPSTNWYVGTNVGVLYTDDAGAHWYNATQPLGLPPVPVKRLRAIAQSNTLYAATYGRGLWRASLGCTPKSCASVGANCGTINDGCGGTRDCGTCAAPQTCGGDGAPNVCSVCQPFTCSPGLSCGLVNDGCGGQVECGGCSNGDICIRNACLPRRCIPKPCRRGWLWDPDTCKCEPGLPQ